MRNAIFIILAVLIPFLAQAEPVISLYGGPDNKQYLGCLNCSPYQQESVHYTHGPYGSEYSETSIFNQKSIYGAKHSDYSPCSRIAFHPPALRDERGKILGYLSLNRFKARAVQNRVLVRWLDHVVCRNPLPQQQNKP